MKEQLLHLGQKTLVYGIGNVLNSTISFLLLPLFTRYLTPVDYGISSTLGWMAFLTTTIFSLGLGTALAQFYFDRGKSNHKEATIWSAVIVLLASTTILIALGIPFAKFWSKLAFQVPDYYHLVTITFLRTGLSILGIPMVLYLQFEERAKLYAAFTVITTFVSIGLNVLLVVVFNRGVQGVIEGYCITQVINFLLFLFPVVSTLKFQFRSVLVIELLRLGIPLIPSSLFLLILQQGNRYILQILGGLDQVGLYTIGYNFGMVMSIPVEALNIAWIPYFMGFIDRREEAGLLFGRIVTFYLFGFGGLSLLFYSFSKPVIMLITQTSFHESYKAVGLSATAFFLSGLFSLLLPGVYFAKEVKYISLIRGIAASFGVVANFLFIPASKVLGAGLGLMFGHLSMVVLILLWNVLHRTQYLQIGFEWRRIGIWSVLYTVYAVCMLWSRDFSFWGECIYSLVALVALLLIILMMLTPWERQSMKQLLLQAFMLQPISRTEKKS